ncbi:MAG: response regulator transcription factor [Rhodospirillales bacterium]
MTKSVLIVEDEINISLPLEYIMKQAGYAVTAVADGEAALDAVASNRPDLILLDVMIPKRDGFDVCQTIRANSSFTGIKIIMLTAKGRDVDREKGLALGVDDFVTKPFSTTDLTARVKKLLGDD